MKNNHTSKAELVRFVNGAYNTRIQKNGAVAKLFKTLRRRSFLKKVSSPQTSHLQKHI